MIRAAGWYCAEDCGVYAPGGGSFARKSPEFGAAAEILSLVGKPVKYYPRMTNETRCCLCAASMALRGAEWSDAAEREIGLLCGASDGLIGANMEYFRDYVENGRTLGRGNLFIYTLATSPLGETAIALSLTGPCMFLEEDSGLLESLVRRAGQLVGDGEADGMLVVCSEPSAAVCMAVDSSAGDILRALNYAAKPNARQICGLLRSMVERE